jgi:ABC-type sugar transport system ATPase subunit
MIALDNITVKAGNFALRNVSLKLDAGEYGALMGRTGCGKTTLLEAIIGLKPVQNGTIRIGEVDVTNERPGMRGIGYVPQDGALFSTMTVREHLAFALEIRKLPKKQINQRVDELAEWLGIESLLVRRPFGLSGGERQRVALGRALSFHPGILLLDEPLSAVDEETRGEMYELLRRVRQETGVTVLHVTHNPDEVRELADAVFNLRDGEIQKEGV